jgi:Na+-transporting NADH:ubiquinone oxidoreductase subunit B
MKSLRKYLDHIKPRFQKGGKYEKLHSTFEAFESFLFVPDTVTNKGVHIRDAVDMKRTMTVVIIALLPALLFGMWNAGSLSHASQGIQASLWENLWFGFLKVLPLLVVSYGVGLGIEFAFAQVRHHEVNEGYLVSGMLIPMIVPIDTPLWMLALSVIFAVVIGKEVFGGTGMNVLNPALTSRAFLFFAYPAEMTGDKVWVSGLKGASQVADGFSGATPLGNLALGITDHGYSVSQMFFGFMPGSFGETSKLAILLGALILIITGIGSWKIMVSMIAGGLFTGYLFNLFAANSYMAVPFWQHLLMGGFLFGAVFMATDPVTAAQTNTGKWIYGFLAGVMSVVIRVLNPAYPEGVMLAILLMNVFAPLIDHYIVEANIKMRLRRAKKAVQFAAKNS